MNPISLTFYAAICGGLSVAAPNLGGFLPRLGIGAIVGLAAAALLPLLKGLVGGY